MGYLIEVDDEAVRSGIPFSSAVAQLQAASSHIEHAFWSAAVRVVQASPGSVAALRAALPRVQVSPQPRGSALIWAGGGDWESSEVHRQLCRVSVLVEALGLLAARHPAGSVRSLSPTQQPGADAMGADGSGNLWALKAFGGIDVQNNDKARKAAQALASVPGVTSRYFACFDDAWRDYMPKTTEFSLIATSTGPSPVALRTV